VIWPELCKVGQHYDLQILILARITMIANPKSGENYHPYSVISCEILWNTVNYHLWIMWFCDILWYINANFVVGCVLEKFCGVLWITGNHRPCSWQIILITKFTDDRYPKILLLYCTYHFFWFWLSCHLLIVTLFRNTFTLILIYPIFENMHQYFHKKKRN
jgi:hypothetical protein